MYVYVCVVIICMAYLQLGLGLNRGPLEYYMRMTVDWMRRMLLRRLYVILIVGRLNVAHLAKKLEQLAKIRAEQKDLGDKLA